MKSQFDLTVNFVPRGERTNSADPVGISEGSTVLIDVRPKAARVSWKRRVFSWFKRT